MPRRLQRSSCNKSWPAAISSKYFAFHHLYPALPGYRAQRHREGAEGIGRDAVGEHDDAAPRTPAHQPADSRDTTIDCRIRRPETQQHQPRPQGGTGQERDRHAAGGKEPHILLYRQAYPTDSRNINAMHHCRTLRSMQQAHAGEQQRSHDNGPGRKTCGRQQACGERRREQRRTEAGREQAHDARRQDDDGQRDRHGAGERQEEENAGPRNGGRKTPIPV